MGRELSLGQVASELAQGRLVFVVLEH
jgi:hypothetical protein